MRWCGRSPPLTNTRGILAGKERPFPVFFYLESIGALRNCEFGHDFFPAYAEVPSRRRPSRCLLSIVDEYRIESMIRMFRRFLSNPGMIGSITPSSSALAEAMTRQIGRGMAVFEIGAGTGVITRHIQKAAPSGHLVIFEQDHLLAEYLRRQIRGARVIEGLFHDTVDGLQEIPDSLDILSSLPFKSLSEDVHEKTVAALCDILLASPSRRLIQYTYFDAPPFLPRHKSLRWRRLSRVWANIPPATVWELRAESDVDSPSKSIPTVEGAGNSKDRTRLVAELEQQPEL